MKHFRSVFFKSIAAGFLAVGIAAGFSPAHADGAVTTLNLTDGTGGAPDKWQHEAYEPGAEFYWLRDQNPAQLEVNSESPNDARWVYPMHLDPGWYHFTADVRTNDVPRRGSGAALALMEEGISSQEVYGTTDWQPVGFYVKVGEKGADVLIACRLGGFASMNSGDAFCTDIKMEQVTQPIAGGDPVWNLDDFHPEASSSQNGNS